MKIGVSYDQGSPKYRLYIGALLAAADAFGSPVEPCWLAGKGRELDLNATDAIDGLILTGGADVEPHRYGFADPLGHCATSAGRDDAEILILEHALTRRIPILAICRGMQLLNVHLGGSLDPHLSTTEAHRLPDDRRHDVTIDIHSNLARISGGHSGAVSSSHHQAVKQLADGLRPVASHADGTLEAFEWLDPFRKPWLAAVQWHPERMSLDEPLAGGLYRGFLQAVCATNGAALPAMPV